jgi:hypothetical protein
MNQSEVSDPVCEKEAKLPRRDWVLLPLIGLLTIFLLAASTEWIARRMLRSAPGAEKCYAMSDPATGMRAIPNSVCREKLAETQPVEYRFNSSGYRADAEFGPKPAGTYLIVLVGSSMALGKGAPVEDTFGALLPAELSSRTGRKIEIYNEALEWYGGSPLNIASRLDKALALHPDMILWTMTAYDARLAAESYLMPDDDPERTLRPRGLRQRASRLIGIASAQFRESVFSIHSATPTISDIFARDTRTAKLLRHFFYRSQSLYVGSFLRNGDDEAGFLQLEQSPAWQQHLSDLDRDAAEIERQAAAANVPLVTVLLPNRAQAAMISTGTWPSGYDPYQFDDKFRSVIESHGGTFIDILPDFRNFPNPERYYFSLDGHLNIEGHQVIADLLSKELTGGAIPALKAAGQEPNAQEHGQ